MSQIAGSWWEYWDRVNKRKAGSTLSALLPPTAGSPGPTPPIVAPTPAPRAIPSDEEEEDNTVDLGDIAVIGKTALDIYKEVKSLGDASTPTFNPEDFVGPLPAPTGGPPVSIPSNGGTPTLIPDGMASCYYYDPVKGKWVRRRRRRRRLLTESDFNDLMRIATLPAKENVKVALFKAIGRRS